MICTERWETLDTSKTIGCKSDEKKKDTDYESIAKKYFSEIHKDTLHCLSPPLQEHSININRLGHPVRFFSCCGSRVGAKR